MCTSDCKELKKKKKQFIREYLRASTNFFALPLV